MLFSCNYNETALKTSLGPSDVNKMLKYTIANIQPLNYVKISLMTKLHDPHLRTIITV